MAEETATDRADEITVRPENIETTDASESSEYDTELRLNLCGDGDE